MKNFMKSLIAALVAVMLLYSFAVGVCAADDYAEAVKMLSALQIKIPDTGNEIPLNRNISKYQATVVFAQAATGKTDLNVWNKPSASSIYTDVTSYGAAVDYMSNSGVITGNGNNIFGFEDAVEYAELLAAAVRILGYETDDMVYPFDHILAAEKLGITDNLDITDYYKSITCGEFAQLVWDMLNTEVAEVDSLSGKILYPGEADSMGATTGVWLERHTLLEENGFFAGRFEAIVTDFIAADEDDQESFDTVRINTDWDELWIRAEDVGITADTPKVSYLGLPVTIYVNCNIDDFCQEAYDNGEASVILCDYPEYTVVSNVGRETNIQYVVNGDDYDKSYLYLAGEKFTSLEYEFVTYEFCDSGWEIRFFDVCSAFEYDFGYVNGPSTYGQVAYRVVESYDNNIKGTIELLYTPYEFGLYNVRTLNCGGEPAELVTVGVYDYVPYINPDEEESHFIEYLVDGRTKVTVDTVQVSMVKGEASKTVKVEGIEINPGEFMFYNYNSVDNILTVAQNCGTFQTGRLISYSTAGKTVKINGESYGFGFAGVYESWFEAAYDSEYFRHLIQNLEPGKDNVKYILVDNRVVYLEGNAEVAVAPQFDFAVVSLDASIIADLLGMSEFEYQEALGEITGIYVENGEVKVAMLNLETGRWELVTVSAIASDWNVDDNVFAKESNLTNAVEYTEIMGESAPAKYTDIVDAFKSIVSDNLVVVVAEEDGVYTIADDVYDDGDYTESFLVYGSAPDGLIFNSVGRTNMITADDEVAPARVSTNENTVIVAIGNDGVAVRKGVQTGENSLLMSGVFYSANENLIVFRGEGDVIDWGDAAVAGDEYYYVVTPDSMMEVELTDDDLYAVTFTDLFDLGSNVTTNVTVFVYDDYHINEFADSFRTGVILFQNASGEVMYTEDDLSDILLNLHPDCDVAEITDFMDGETIGGAIGSEYLNTAMAVDINVNVVTLNLTDVDFADYDLDTMYVDLAYDETLGYDVDTVKVGDVEYYAYALDNILNCDIEEPTEGIYDQFIIDTALTPVYACNNAGEYEQLFTVELYTVGFYDYDNGTVSLYVLKRLCGESAEREPVEIPTPEETPVELKDYDFAIVTLDSTVMSYLLDMSEEEYENSLTSGLYVKDGLVAVAVMNTATGMWELGYADSVASDYSAEDDEFTTVLNIAEAAEYAEIMGESAPAKYLETVDSFKSIVNNQIATAVSEENGVYVLAALDNALVGCAENTNGLVFADDGTTNAITASEDVEAQSYATHDGTVVIAVDTDGIVGVRKGLQTPVSSISGEVTYYAVGNDLIVVLTSGFDVVGWSMLEIEDTPDIEEPSVPEEYGYAIMSLDACIMADLLDMSEFEYQETIGEISGLYVEDGEVKVAMLNLATGKWELAAVSAIASAWNYEKNAFDKESDISAAAEYVEILGESAPAKYTDVLDSFKSLAAGGLVVIVSEESGVYTIAADEASIIKCCENESGLIFNSVGRTNMITADADVAPARVSTNERTVIVAIGNDVAGSRVGVQSEELSISMPVVFYSANENLIVFKVDAPIADWLDIRGNVEEKYYLATNDAYVEVDFNEDGGFTTTIDGLFDLETSEMAPPLAFITETIDEFISIVEGMVIAVFGDEVQVLGDIAIEEILAEVLSQNGDYWEVANVDSFIDFETIRVFDANGDILVSDREALVEINAQVVTLDYTGIDWKHFNTEDMFVETGMEDASVLIPVGDTELYGEFISLDISTANTVINAPVKGIYDDSVKAMAGKTVLVKGANDDEYEDSIGITYSLHTVAHYDSAESTLQLYVLRVLRCVEDSYDCRFGEFGQYSKTEHARICRCGYVDYQRHTFGEWVETVAATSEKAGVKVRTCSECLYKEKASIPSLDVAVITVDSVIGRVGEAIEVDISLRNGTGIGGIEFAVAFDNELMELEEIKMADAFSAFTVTPLDVANLNGSIDFCYADTKNIGDSGTVATLVFTVQNASDGYVTPLTVSYSDGVAFYYDGESLIDLALDNIDGKIAIYNYVPGDVNNDRTVNVRDAAMLLQSLAHWEVTIHQIAADVNCDGYINIRDAAMILQYIAGWEITLGEPAVQTVSLFSLRAAVSATVSVSDVVCKSGESFTVDVNVCENSGFGGMEFSVDFDKSVFELAEIDQSSAMASFTVTPADKANETGRITFGYVGLENIIGDGNVAKLTFKVADGADGDFALTVTDRAASFYYADQSMMDLVLETDHGSVTVKFAGGDVNNDGVLDMVDCLMVVRAVMNDSTLNNADMNNDGKVNLLDVIRILKAIVA